MEIDWDKINDAPSYDKCVFDQVIEAKVVSVYDGDSIKAIFPLHGVLYKWTCRLTGIDTPELRTSCDVEKEMGYKVRDILREKILNKVVKLHCWELDKYGRLLVRVICDDGVCVNDWLIDNEYAFAYDGGTKRSWKEFLERE